MQLASTRLVVFVALHTSLAAAGFAVDHLLAWLAIWAIQAVNMLTVVGIVHECVHQHFMTTRLANRIVGTLASIFGLTCFEAYRSQHVMHHAHTCGEGDAEGEPYKFTARWQIVGAFLGGGAIFTLLLVWSGVRVAAGATPAWLTAASQRRRIRINVLALALVALTVLFAVQVDIVSWRSLAFAWLIPVGVSLLGPVPFVLIPEHYDAPGPGSTLTNTRTCVSNPVLRFFYLNTNLHTAHHDRPSVPWHRLGSHHQEIENDIGEHWIFPSYTAFHRWMWNTVGEPAASESIAA